MLPLIYKVLVTVEAEENKRLVAQLQLYHETSSTKTTQKLMFLNFCWIKVLFIIG